MLITAITEILPKAPRKANYTSLGNVSPEASTDFQS